jgi:hypothetical protein
LVSIILNLVAQTNRIKKQASRSKRLFLSACPYSQNGAAKETVKWGAITAFANPFFKDCYFERTMLGGKCLIGKIL